MHLRYGDRLALRVTVESHLKAPFQIVMTSLDLNNGAIAV